MKEMVGYVRLDDVGILELWEWVKRLLFGCCEGLIKGIGGGWGMVNRSKRVEIVLLNE